METNLFAIIRDELLKMGVTPRQIDLLEDESLDYQDNIREVFIPLLERFIEECKGFAQYHEDVCNSNDYNLSDSLYFDKRYHKQMIDRLNKV